MDSERAHAVASRIAEYLKSPSLRHIRDPHQIHKLAREILDAVDRPGAVWEKWQGERDLLAKAAACCWIPEADLRAYLNRLPGPLLTATDLAQRLRAIWEEPWSTYPDDELQSGCLALYDAEKAQGTELPAIIGALQEHVAAERARLRDEREDRYRRRRDEDRERAQKRFLAGADCGWTKFGRPEEFLCRRNGRAFRISRGSDKRWKLYRIADAQDAGVQLGAYSGRRDANAALQTIAYEPEPRW